MIPIILVDLYHLTSLEKYVVSEINKRPEYFLNNSITIISQNFGIATSTISRLAKKIGCKNFKELKIFIIERIKQTKNSFNFEHNDKLSNIIQNIKNINLYSIFETINNLDLLEINDIINCIFISKRIFIFGVGTSNMICSELNNNLIKLGFNSYTSQDFYEILLLLNSFKNNDLIILFSKAGYTREINELVKLSKKNRIKAILITDEHKSNNYIQSDYKILYYTYSHKQNHFLSISNKIPELIISNILVAMLLEMLPEKYQEMQKGKILIDNWNIHGTII